MTVGELFRQHSWGEVRIVLRRSSRFFESRNWDIASNRLIGWERAFRSICNAPKVTPSNITITGHHSEVNGETFIQVFGLQNGNECFLHFCTLTEWSIMPVDTELFLTSSPIDIIVNCLFEMTINGYSDEEITSRVQEIISRKDEPSIPHEEAMERIRMRLEGLVSS